MATNDPPTPLPPDLRTHWEGRPDPRQRSSFCSKQAAKTPEMPWHNGTDKCTACRQPLDHNPILTTRKSAAHRLHDAAFVEEATMLFEQLGARPNEDIRVGVGGVLGGSYPFGLNTVAGLLLVHVYEDAVFMRFVDVDLAREHLPHRSGDSLNPYSGKWNVHLPPVPVAERMAALRAHLTPLLLPVS